MSDNSTGAAPRTPRLRVLLDGTTEITPQYAEITHMASYAAAMFTIAVPLAARPDLNVGFWLASSQPEVQIQVALNAWSPYIELISGRCDSMHLNPITGVVRLQGRDRAASLLDTKSSIVYQNRTSSEIATDLATRHGLTPAVAPSSGYAGRYYANETQLSSLVQFSKLVSDWDILVSLAQLEGFDLYVTGSVLTFQPRTPGTQAPQWIDARDLMDLHISRSLALSGGINTSVRSWDSANQTFVSASGSSPGSSKSAPRYSIIKPNLSPHMAETLASQMASDIYRNSMRVSMTMPGSMDLSIRTPLMLTGLATPLAQIFEIEVIKRSFRSKSGFVQKIFAVQSTA